MVLLQCHCKNYLFTDWEEEQVSSPNILRLIYQGRFLHGNVTLGGMKIIFTHVITRKRKYLQCSKYDFTVQDQSMACYVLFFLCKEWRYISLRIFSILLPLVVKLWEVPPGKSSLLLHKETVIMLLFVVFLNGILCSTSYSALADKLLQKCLKYFKTFDKDYDNWLNNTLNLSPKKEDILWMRMRRSILAVQCSPRDTIA